MATETTTGLFEGKTRADSDRGGEWEANRREEPRKQQRLLMEKPERSDQVKETGSGQASATISENHRPLSRIQGEEVPYMAPPTPTQPLAVLSPTPIGGFPSNAQTPTTPTAPAPPDSPASAPSEGTTVTIPPYWLANPPKAGDSNSGPPVSGQLLRSASWASTEDPGAFAGIKLRDNEVDDRNAACWARSVTIRDYTIVNGSSTIPRAIRPALARVRSSKPASRSGGGVVHEGGMSPSALSPAVSPRESLDRQLREQQRLTSSENGLLVPDEVEYDYGNANSGGSWGGSIARASLGMGGIGAFVVFNVSIETLDGGTFEIKRRYSEFDELRTGLAVTFPRREKAMPELPPKSVVSRFRPQFLDRRRRGLEYFLSCVLLNPDFAGSPVTKQFIFASGS